MPCWYYDKKELRHTPSVTQGVSQEDETMYRREGARFILQLGNKMGLRYETMATGVVYFHRFYMIHSFQEFPRHVTACCCLFLAGKVEETPKKCKDIMKHARSLVDDATWSEFGTDPREEVMTLERILLQTIKFDFIVEHPYTYLLKYAKCLKGDKKKLQNMVQMAWTFVNDGLCTTLCLQWEPEIIAIALMYLAGKLNKFEVVEWTGKIPRHQKWWDMFVQGISMELLEDICHQVLDLYSPNKTENSTSLNASTPKVSRPVIDSSTSTTKSVDNASKIQALTPVGPPPAKKAKKEETKIVSPAKPDTPITQPYQQYPAYPNYPPSYPPPSQTVAPTVSTTPQRYTYPYPSTTPQHPPLPQQPAQLAHLTPPSSYQTLTPSNRYPVSAPTTPAGPPPHYTSQAPPQAHYSSSHPPPFPPLSGAAPPPHYPTPPGPQHHTPGSQHNSSSSIHHNTGSQHHTPSSHHTSASLHHTPSSQHHTPYSHYTTPSFYQPPPTPPNNIPTTYQQPPANSYATPPTNYSHTSRPYYPPAS